MPLEPHDRPLRALIHAVSQTEAGERPTVEVPELGQQSADAVRKATEIAADDLNRAAEAMRYAGKKLAADIEMFTSLALLVSTKTRALTEK